MKNWFIIFIIVGVNLANRVVAQEVEMIGMASWKQIQGDIQTSDELIPMNDLGMDDGGYVLYETTITMGSKASLEIENVRDYASVYLDEKLIGELDNDNKSLDFTASEGEHLLQLYAENTGRITYGPEILDNLKGLFGTVELDGEELTTWKIVPLSVRTCDVNRLDFSSLGDNTAPCFYRCTFSRKREQELHIDMSGWGIGEVWLNGEYLGSYWERNSQQSLMAQDSMWKEGENTLIVFELKNKGKHSVKLSDKPIFSSFTYCNGKE